MPLYSAFLLTWLQFPLTAVLPYLSVPWHMVKTILPMSSLTKKSLSASTALVQVWLAASFAAVSKIYGALYSMVATIIQYMVPPIPMCLFGCGERVDVSLCTWLSGRSRCSGCRTCSYRCRGSILSAWPSGTCLHPCYNRFGRR